MQLKDHFKKISFEEYSLVEAARSSGLKEIITRSPMHYKAKYIDKTTADAPTAAQRFGTIAHTALLEPTRFLENYRVKPDVDKRTVKGKADLKDFEKELTPSSIVVSGDERETLLGMINAIQSHGIARELLADGTAELSGFFMDGASSVKCKFRPDFLRNDGVIVDLKTTMDASYRSFQRDISNYYYHMQAAFYLDGLKYLLGKEQDPDMFVFLAVEKMPPYGLAIYCADFGMIEKGRELNRKAIDTYQTCVRNKAWPGYTEEPTNISLPPWAF